MRELHRVWCRHWRLLRVIALGRASKSYGADIIAEPRFALRALERLAVGRPSFTRWGRGRQSRYVHLRRYLEALRSTAWEWGLRSERSVAGLHVAMVEPFVLSQFGGAISKLVLRGAVRSYSWVVGADEIVVKLRVEEHDEWRDVKKNVLTEARRQWEVIQRDWESRVGWERVDTKPELERHLRWLYLRICPRPERGRPLSWHAIASREGVGVTTITKVVKQLAQEMVLDLPKVPPGRPPQFSD